MEDRRDFGGTKFKVDIPYFDGHLHIEDYLDWEIAIKIFFEYTEIAIEKQAHYVACKLQSGALARWTQLVKICKQQGKRSVQSWQKNEATNAKSLFTIRL